MSVGPEATPQAAPAETGDAGAAPEVNLGSEPTTGADSTSTPPAEEPAGDATTQQQILSRVAEQFGFDARQKYRSDDEYLRASTEAFRALSRRDEDAVLGRALRGQEQAFLAFLQAQQQQQHTPPPQQQQQEQPPSWEEFQLLKAKVLDNQGNLRPDASHGDVEQLAAMNDVFQRTLFDLAFRREEAIGSSVDPKLNQAQQIFQHQIAAELQRREQMVAEEQRVSDFEGQHKSWLYADKNTIDSGLTPLGQKFAQYATEYFNTWQQRGIEPPRSEVAQYAYNRLKAEEGTAVSGVTTKPQALRKPGVAPRSAAVDVAKLVDKMSMSDFQAYSAQHPEVAAYLQGG